MHPVEALHRRLLDAWNRRDAAAMADRFAPDGSLVGFDGSQADGRREVLAHLEPIFRDHPTASFVARTLEVRDLAPRAVLLRAVAGMVPPGGDAIDPAANAVQSLVAVERDGAWLVVLFQNTPAAWHGRPDDVAALTRTLQGAWDDRPQPA